MLFLAFVALTLMNIPRHPSIVSMQKVLELYLNTFQYFDKMLQSFCSNIDNWLMLPLSELIFYWFSSPNECDDLKNNSIY